MTKAEKITVGIENIIGTLGEYSGWLHPRRWEWFEVLALGLIALSLLMVLTRTRRQVRRPCGDTPSGPLRDFRKL